MMSLKAAISDLPHGGAKAVIIRPKHIPDRKAFFESYGDFVHTLNGRYITAIDVGTSVEDMNSIATRTPYVIGATTLRPTDSDPSPYTAMGVLKSLEAALYFKKGHSVLKDIHVAIQGIGAVGYYLGYLLHQRGAKLTVCDIDANNTQRMVRECGAQVVSPEKIYAVPCDVFAPCAMGSILRVSTLQQMQTSIIVGSANNQLAHSSVSRLFEQKGILYVPDFLANSGGLIASALAYDNQPSIIAEQKIETLYHTTLTLLERAAEEQKTTVEIAIKMAEEKLGFLLGTKTPFFT
eukprot:TRINITY_DN2554_c0_g2_i1.p3 TRINITY_DN2554_c0_g2~~TRINITY_DN2554_c0_g2_i1.p3  ORF type:complete len:293 (+),score=-48.95 TRINITY_DN2554_c0_g2_i1:443-1321(+)